MAERDEELWVGPASLEFQTPVRGKKQRRLPSQSSGISHAQQMTAALGRIGRVARHRPEVMVKITGSARGRHSLKEHLAYITRNGKLVAEREDGTLIAGAANVRSLAEEWWSEASVDRPTKARDTINLILSMPPRTDPRAVESAARAFARKTFGGDHDYLLAHHNHDVDPRQPENPHAHLSILTRGRNVHRLDPRKRDLQAWRNAFAAELRACGVEAEATPRRTRGVIRKGQRQVIRHMDTRRASHVTRWKLQQAIKMVTEGKDEGTAVHWGKLAKERQRKIRHSWNILAAAFEDAGQVAQARQIRQFIATMTPPLTEREHLVMLAKKLIERTQDREKER